MTGTIIVTGTFEIPLAPLVDAVGEEVTRTMNVTGRNPLAVRSSAKEIMQAVERVISALNHLEIVTNTVGEGPARQSLMNAVRGLRTANLRKRNR